MEELVCNWMLQLAMWHRQPGFLWIDSRYEARLKGDHFEHHCGVLLSFGKSTAAGVSTQRLRFTLHEFAIDRAERTITPLGADLDAGISGWSSTVTAREILEAECPRFPLGMPRCKGDNSNPRRGFAAVQLTRGWSVVYPAEIELVT